MFKKRPPCPGHPEDYLWVESKEGGHWRRKRGSLSPSPLNKNYQDSSDKTKIASPASRRVRNAIAPYLRGISTGRLHNRICNAFRKSIRETGEPQLGYLNGIEIQRDYPLEQMLLSDYRVFVNEKSVRIEIPVERGSVKAFNRLVSDYYFEAVLLYGDVTREKGLKIESAESALYSFNGGIKSICVLELEMPEEDWCLLLKISCIEGKEMAAHTKHYRMKVIAP